MQSTMQQTTEQLVAKIKNPIIKWNHHTGSHLLSEHKMRMLGFPSFYYKVWIIMSAQSYNTQHHPS